MPKIKIGNKEYEVTEFSLNDTINIEEKIGDIRQLGKKEKISDNLKDVRYVIWYILHKHNNKITEEEVGEMIPIAEITKLVEDIFEAVNITGNPIVTQKQ